MILTKLLKHWTISFWEDLHLQYDMMVAVKGCIYWSSKIAWAVQKL